MIFLPGRRISSTTYLIYFACKCLPGILTVQRRPPPSSVVQLFCDIKAYLCCFTQFTVEQSKLTVNGSALSDTPNVRYLVALYFGFALAAIHSKVVVLCF